MRDRSDAAGGLADLRADPQPKQRWWIRLAPAPDYTQPRDLAGARLGMLLALTVGGLFWGLVAAAVVWLTR